MAHSGKLVALQNFSRFYLYKISNIFLYFTFKIYILRKKENEMLSTEYYFNKYFLQLSVFAFPWVGSEEIAKDIVQDAFIVLMSRQDLLEKGEPVIKSFLYSSVKNLAMNIKRRNIVFDRVRNQLDTDKPDDNDILDNLINAELIGALHRELNELPEGCQRICRLIYLDGMKYEEVAQELNVSVNTVKTQRMRAINLLKRKFLNILFSFFIL
jgi:RNA polymerase sigma-70 factor (ECF subfamily)